MYTDIYDESVFSKANTKQQQQQQSPQQKQSQLPQQLQTAFQLQVQPNASPRSVSLPPQAPPLSATSSKANDTDYFKQYFSDSQDEIDVKPLYFYPSTNANTIEKANECVGDIKYIAPTEDCKESIEIFTVKKCNVKSLEMYCQSLAEGILIFPAIYINANDFKNKITNSPRATPSIGSIGNPSKKSPKLKKFCLICAFFIVFFQFFNVVNMKILGAI